MDISGQGFSFGNFECLDPEEYAAVERILREPRPGTKKVQFPWDLEYIGTEQVEQGSQPTFDHGYVDTSPPHPTHPLSGMPVFQGALLPPFAIPIGAAPVAIVPALINGAPPHGPPPVVSATHPVVITATGPLPVVSAMHPALVSPPGPPPPGAPPVISADHLAMIAPVVTATHPAMIAASTAPCFVQMMNNSNQYVEFMQHQSIQSDNIQQTEGKKPEVALEKTNVETSKEEKRKVFKGRENSEEPKLTYNESPVNEIKQRGSVEKEQNLSHSDAQVSAENDYRSSHSDVRAQTPNRDIRGFTVVKYDHGSNEIAAKSTPGNLQSNVDESSSTSKTVEMELPVKGTQDNQLFSSPDTSNCDTELSVSSQTVIKTDDSTNEDGKSRTSSQNINTTPVKENAKPAAPSWAGLFKSCQSNAPVIKVDAVEKPVVVEEMKTVEVASVKKRVSEEKVVEEVVQAISPDQDKAAKHLGELLETIFLNHVPISLQPRGLINRGNWCYISATLQALVACPPFYHLMKNLPSYTTKNRGASSTPILDSIIEFVGEFYPFNVRATEKIDKSGAKGKRVYDLPPGAPFEPVNIYKMLQIMEANPSFRHGRQEDAEEFLSCVLDGLHEEMCAAMKCSSKCLTADNNKKKTVNNKVTNEITTNGFLENDDENEKTQPAEENDDESWEQVGPKNKSVLTRKADFATTPVSKIFSGYIRSAVYQSSSKESANLQPFFTLQLDIQSEKIWNLKDALEGLVTKESVHGYTCSKTKAEVEIVRRTTLEELPPVLILHLKCFVYDKNGGSQKLLKKIDYSVEMEITKDLLSPSVKNKLQYSQRSYKLFAVVFHHGKQATGGHYTTAVYHPGINGWIHIDDSVVKRVNLPDVLKFASPRVPYLLYYRRTDINQ